MDEKVKKRFNNILQKVKSKPYQYGFFFALFTLLVIPGAIWVAYFIGDCGFVLINTSLTVGDALGFYGTVLTFIGTTFLGVVAYRQNEMHNKREADWDNANTLTPYLAIDSVYKSNKERNPTQFETSHYKVEGKKAVVQIKNIGQGIATGVFYKHWFGKLHNPQDSQMNMNLQVDSTFEIQLSATEKNVNKLQKKVIQYQNVIGFQYQQVLSYKLVLESEPVENEDWEEHYYLHVYLLGKQERLGMEENTTDDNSEW